MPNLQTNSGLELGLRKEDQTKHKDNRFQSLNTSMCITVEKVDYLTRMVTGKIDQSAVTFNTGTAHTQKPLSSTAVDCDYSNDKHYKYKSYHNHVMLCYIMFWTTFETNFLYY